MGRLILKKDSKIMRKSFLLNIKESYYQQMTNQIIDNMDIQYAHNQIVYQLLITSRKGNH